MKKYYLINEEKHKVANLTGGTLFTLNEVLDYLLRDQAHWIYNQVAEEIDPLILRKNSIEFLYKMTKAETEEEIRNLAWEFNLTMEEAEEE